MVIILLISILGISPALGFRNPGLGDRTGCSRRGVFYVERANVPSDELCQSCVCSAGEIKCNTQQCRRPRYNCKPVGFIKGTCCPLKFECDDEINEIVEDIPFSIRFRSDPIAKSCTSHGKDYFSGESIPTFAPCQDNCACVDGSIACTHSACPPAPPAFLRCIKFEDSKECCPTYSCASTPITKQSSSCEYKGVQYEDGEFVPNSDLCTDCYCLDGEVVCAFADCPEPPADNCRPVTSSHESCCPQKYECPMVQPEEIDTTESPKTTADPYENMESTTTNEDVVFTIIHGDIYVTEHNNEVATEQTTTVFEEGTEASTMTSDNLTTSEPISILVTDSEIDSTEAQNSILTTISPEDEFTTLAKIGEYSESVTESEQTTSYYADNETTTDSDLDETTTEATTSTDDITTESSFDYSTVTESEMATETTTLVFEDMCSNGGTVYNDGESIPPTSQCQDSCHCRNGTVTCIEKACSPAPPAFLRCAYVEVMDDSDECCPTYECPSIIPSPESEKCLKDGIEYEDGEFVPSANLCTDCYCLYGEILCAFLECSPPVRDSCAPIYDDERACCPQHYECDIVEDVQTTTMYPTTEEPEASNNLRLRNEMGDIEIF